MMSLLKKKPRYEVISIRLNEDRLKLLERYQKVLGDQLGREVSLGEAAFLVIEERGAGLDRETVRHEMLSTPTSSLYRIRKKWESKHTWYYFRNLGGQSIDSKASLDKDGEKVHQAVLKQISTRRELLKLGEKWQSPGAVGACLLIAVR